MLCMCMISYNASCTKGTWIMKGAHNKFTTAYKFTSKTTCIQIYTAVVNTVVHLLPAQEFFLTVKDLLHKLPSGVDSYCKFQSPEKQLNKKYADSTHGQSCMFGGPGHIAPHVKFFPLWKF